MANRFVRLIKAGSIWNVGGLKAAFKAAAKNAHPDLAGPGSAEEFISVRAEYEAALRDFEKHRFGFRAEKEESLGHGGDERSLFAALALLRKRDFPRRPRHHRQKLRYDYARSRLTEEFAGPVMADEPESFDTFEKEAWRLEKEDPRSAARLGKLLDGLVEYAFSGTGELRVALVMDLGSFRSDARIGKGIRAFVDALAEKMGIGPTLGAEEKRL